ncbi:cell division protein FtsQ/DivIB [Kangiella sediminilitoris]|uniref:Cell division protein FtsQ n=1 Tax=Kangiella sediminilitoris TaxID=1144748 RepID=A0A1B3BCE5_9GAMM|nr:cell division protein FtsQ/DivIB [Kangiella sediminilitoris]AOE50462.1 Cell division protein FtsQ [Kangiella sediminilitoris]
MAKMATRSEKQQRSFSGLIKPLKWAVGLLGGALVAAGLVFGGIWVVSLNTDNVFPINKVELRKQQYTHALGVYEVLRSIEDRGFFTMDMALAEEKLLQLPWVKKAQLRKIWPDTLQVVVTEHQPMAYWGDSGVVSRFGEVFYPVELPNADWVKLSGPDNMAKDLTELLQLYQEQLLQKNMVIEKMELTQRGAIDLVLAEGLTVRLGNVHVEERIERFLQYIDSVKEQKDAKLAYVDLRYQNGMAAQWVDNKTSVTSDGGSR